VRWGQFKPPVDPEVYWEAAADFDEALDAEMVAEIADLLEKFDGEETCKRLFWETLSFDRARQPLRASFLANSVAERVESLEVFAASLDLAVVLAEAPVALEHYHLERLCRGVVSRLPACLVLLHEQPDDAWTLIYPDITKKAFLRVLPLPGAALGRIETAQALAALEAADPRTGEAIPWLALAERLERFFPGGTPGRRDDLKYIAVYIRDISRFPLLTALQERGAGLTSGQEAPDDSGMEYQRWRLVVHNLRYVVYRALQLPRLRLQIEDLIQEGSLGLLRAAELYDPTMGNRFLTYAHYWIRQRMLAALAENCNLIRWPMHRTQDLLLKNRRGETDGLTPGERVVASLDRTMLERVRHWRPSQIAEHPLERAAGGELREAVARAMAALKDRERQIVVLRFGIGSGRRHTLEEIARMFRITRERVRQIEAKALERLQNPARLRQLRRFLS